MQLLLDGGLEGVGLVQPEKEGRERLTVSDSKE